MKLVNGIFGNLKFKIDIKLITDCFYRTNFRMLKKTRFPKNNTFRKACRPALPDIGESLSAYLQATYSITHNIYECKFFLYLF